MTPSVRMLYTNGRRSHGSLTVATSGWAASTRCRSVEPLREMLKMKIGRTGMARRLPEPPQPGSARTTLEKAGYHWTPHDAWATDSYAAAGWSGLTALKGAGRRAAPPTSGDRIRLAFLTDIVTPYLLVLFEELDRQTELGAVFCSHTGTRAMEWGLQVQVRHEIVEGLAVRRRSPDATDYYLSPRILAALHRARPQVIVSAGFSVPSLYAAAYSLARNVPLL